MIIKKRMHKSVVVCFSVFLLTQSAIACFGVIVGKNASADGSVLVGHDEQNSGTRVINFKAIPRRQFSSGETVAINQTSGVIEQVAETNAFLWTQNIGIEFGDAYINEFGVSVVSDACPSRETGPAFSNGGIKYMLRRIVAERAHTARHGVHVAGDLVHQFGYGASGAGRTYIIADTSEAWLMAIVPGKHWFAQRVPDDEVAVIPNIYISREIDLADTNNFLASPDLIDYAKDKGWYSSGTFIFTNVYGKGNITSEYSRQRNGQSKLTTNLVPNGQPLPFSVKPDNKVTIAAILEILHANDDNRTQEGTVFQMRAGMPVEIGCVYWRTTARPRYSILTPWYAGITITPEYYCKKISPTEQLTLNYQFNPPSGTFSKDPDLVWWDFKELEDKVANNTAGAMKVRAIGDEYERRAYEYQKLLDLIAVTLYQSNKDSAISLINNFSTDMAYKAVTLAKKMNQSWITSSSTSYCKALATAAPIRGMHPFPVAFDGFGCSNENIVSYSWDFGDGNTSDKPSPVYTYESDGVFTARLTVENSSGKKDTDSITIEVEQNTGIQKHPGEHHQEGIALVRMNRGEGYIDIYYTMDNRIVPGTIQIITLSGRIIKEITLGDSPEGIARWDGSTVNNLKASHGIYFCAFIHGGTFVDVRKVVWR